ncbi:MAG TPA: hypothetical protein PKE45_04870, partial [Caldilineaceae bacterium]|nr:hypothetical protein [Caldilineaceae bacterium]
VADLASLVEELDHAQWWQAEPEATLFAELRGVYEAVQQSSQQLDTIILGAKSGEGLVKWLELNENADTVLLAAAP